MKRINYLLILTIVAYSLITVSCRKGEEDPFISFRSRNQRLIGKWKLVEEKINIEKYTYKEANYLYKGLSNTREFYYKSEVYSILATQQQYKKTGNFYLKESALVLYGDTLNILDSTTNKQSVFEKVDSVCNGLYEIIVDIKKNNEFTQTENKDFSITYKDTIWGKSFGYFDCGNTVYYPMNSAVNNNTHSATNYSYNNSWKWKNEKKSIVDAGYMSGKITRLSNNEIIINDEYTTEDYAQTPNSNNLLYPYHYYCFTGGNIPVISPIKYLDSYNRYITKTTIYQRWERIKE